MTIKQIFDEIASESSTNRKMEILAKYKENETLKRVLYLANSKRIKFYIKQIPDYIKVEMESNMPLEKTFPLLEQIYTRQVTGGLASQLLHLCLQSSSIDDAYIIERIIEKDCKIGMGTTNINKIFPSLIEKTYYMGAIPYDAKKAVALFSNGAEAISEVKADGRYCNFDIAGNEVELVSRQGEETLIGDSLLLKELSLFDDCVLNGELVIDGYSREISNGLLTSIIDINKKLRSGDGVDKALKSIDTMFKRHGIVYGELLNKIRLIVWDIIDREDYFTNINTVERIERLNRLKEIVSKFPSTMISVVEHKFVKSHEEALEHFAEVLARGEEGTVLKSKTGVWKSGKHSYQIKMKVEFDLDLRITGFNYGTKGSKNENVISSLTCESQCGKLVANAQGISESEMEHITQNQDKLINTIAKVKCNGLSKNRNGGFSVLYPTLMELRDDKTTADSYEECLAIENMIKGLR